MSQRKRAPLAPMANSIAEEIRQIRESRGLSQERLASLLDYSVKQVVRWETGISLPRKVVVETIRKLSPRGVVREHSSTEEEFTFVDLFAGIGGLRKGFESIGGRCIFTS